MTRLLRWIAPFVLALCCWLPVAHAQTRIPADIPDPRVFDGEGKAYAGAYAIAFLSTVLILSILCAPSRRKM